MIIFSGKGIWEQRKKIRDFGVYACKVLSLHAGILICHFTVFTRIKNKIRRNTNKTGVTSLLQNQDV